MCHHARVGVQEVGTKDMGTVEETECVHTEGGGNEGARQCSESV